MSRGKGPRQRGKHDALTPACTAWLIYRVIIELQENRNKIRRSLAQQQEGETKALLLLLCKENQTASWYLDKALQKRTTPSSKGAGTRDIFKVVQQYAMDTLGAGLAYTVRRVSGKGLGIVAKRAFAPSAESLSATLYGTVEAVSSKQDALWSRLRESNYNSLYEAGGVRGLMIGPLSLANDVRAYEEASFVIKQVSRAPLRGGGDVALAASDRSAITVVIGATCVRRAVRVFSATGNATGGFKKSVLARGDRIKQAEWQTCVTIEEGEEVSLEYGAAFGNTTFV
jgi:hypothetical protein